MDIPLSLGAQLQTVQSIDASNGTSRSKEADTVPWSVSFYLALFAPRRRMQIRIILDCPIATCIKPF
jgi:hypothetical protein